MATRHSIQINERQILHLYFDNPSYLMEENQLFVTEEGKNLFHSLIAIQTVGEKASKDTWKKHLKKSVSDDVIDSILETEYEEESFPQYLQKQRTDYYCMEFDNKLSEKLTEGVTRKDKSVDQIREILAEGEDLLAKIEGHDSTMSNMSDLIDSHIDTLKKRSEDNDFLTTGDKHLDSILSYPFAVGEMTIIAASSGIGKTTFARNLIIKRILKKMPTMYFSLEMSEEAFSDPTLSVLSRVSMQDFLGYDGDEGGERIPSHVFENMEKTKKRYAKHNTFYFSEESTLSIADLKMMIKKHLKLMPKSNYCPTVFVDLLTMLGDFNFDKGSMASVYERAINQMSALAKELGIHIVNIVQLRRPSDKVKIENYDDIMEKLKPTPEVIKNSSSLLERSRGVILLFRPKHYGIMYLGENDPEVRTADDIMYAYLAKQNRGKLGEVKYLCDFDKNKLYPYKDDERVNVD